MSEEPVERLRLVKCETCHGRFASVDGPCPRCGSTSIEAYLADGVGTVLASTALEVPPPGWDVPHRLALVEVEDGVRLLVLPDPPLPDPGTQVEVRADGAIYRARAVSRSGRARGEGDAPEVGASRPPFEPPR